MRSTIVAFVFFSILGAPEAINIQRASSRGAATVDLTNSTGPAAFKASGWIYGFPDNGTHADNSIPEGLVRDVKFGASRAGGAQIAARGWVNGYASYVPRMQSALSNYRTTRKYGGSFILLIHDLWGADGSSISKYPGDNGDWTMTDTFLQQVVSDLRDNDMLEGLVIDLWNEPDITTFWVRSWQQYLDYYVHANAFFRNKLPNTTISGPSMANSPISGNEKWLAWMKTISGNKSIPNIYSWHQIGNWQREPDTTVPAFNSMKAMYGLPDLPIDINEYATKDEQNPGTSVYYIAQLERHNLRGLRSNWGSGSGLHNYLANLIYSGDGTYHPNGEWQLYMYYATMGGDRVATTASPDLLFDVFATRSGQSAKIIAGTRNVQAAYEIRIAGLASLGLPESGSVNVQMYRFDWSGDRGAMGAPVNLGSSALRYSAGTLTFQVNPPNNSTAYAYEISGTV